MKTMLFFLLSFSYLSYSQVEHVHIYHPVYDFLIRAEAKGLLPYFSTSQLPLQRKDIISALQELEANKSQLSENEYSTLKSFLQEFAVINKPTAVIFKSDTDTNQLFFNNLFKNKEKYVYNYEDSINSVRIEPLGSVENMYQKYDKTENALIAQGGGRLYGTIQGKIGYFLQATNGTILSGPEDVLLHDRKLSQNIKLTELHSDFDFTESHIRAEFGSIYFYIGRESRLLGSGINQRLFNSDLAPPYDAIALGYKSKNFEYRFTHGSLLGSPIDTLKEIGFNSEFNNKYISQHRFALKMKKGEIALYEAVIYSRGIDLAYLNPLRFLKTLEHALRDRDNTLLGADFTYRPINNFELKGSYILDDIIFSKIGEGFWSNKAAYNVGFWYTPGIDLDFGLEYARVEPYTFSHFNYQNAVLNDSKLIMGYLTPNSEKYSLSTKYWWGGRYPLKLDLEYLRHGENIYQGDSLYYNAGGNPLQTRRPQDKESINFLDGKKVNILSAQIDFTFEVTRNLNIGIIYRANYNEFDKKVNHHLRTRIRFWEF